MSSRTPTECVELAVDASADRDAREEAIHELKLANECDELAALVRNEDLEEELRRRALRSLGTSQCDSMLEKLAADDSLDRSLRREAEDVLEEL